MGNSWSAAAQGGLSYAKRAKQWFRTPDAMVTFVANAANWPQEDNKKRFMSEGQAQMVSPPGAPETYGFMEPVTVRSVGFGLMPVEATVQVSQRRSGGYPIPMHARIDFVSHLDPVTGKILRQVTDQTTVKDAFNVRILKVRVDGEDLGLTGNCRTVEPAPVTMIGPAYTIEDPDRYPSYKTDWFRTTDPTTFFHPTFGGQLTGTLTIPAFTGCTTKVGDDLSKLMTLSVSGPDNPVVARVGWPCGVEKDGVGWPLATGQNTPKRVPAVVPCAGTKKFEYPQRPAN